MGSARHFLDLGDAGTDAIAAMIADAIDRKDARKHWPKGKVDADKPLEGRVLALMGRNGMGKSTTVKVICRLLANPDGQVTFAGHDLTTLPAF